MLKYFVGQSQISSIHEERVSECQNNEFLCTGHETIACFDSTKDVKIFGEKKIPFFLSFIADPCLVCCSLL